MDNWDIINKQDPLTVSEYKQLYNSIFKDDTVKILWKEPEIYQFINKIIIKLRYLSKSGKANFPWCKQKFQYTRILMPSPGSSSVEMYKTLGIPILKQDIYDSLTIAGKVGGNAHMVYDKVWDRVSINKILNFRYQEEISNYFYIKCKEFIPDGEINLNLYDYLFKQFADYESYRITEVFDVIGRGNGCKKYVLPVDREVKVENLHTNQAGVIDVTHLLFDDSIGITDYKTGKPKYYGRTKWETTDIEVEITEYYSLIQEGAYRVVDKDNMIPFEHINVDFGRLLYIRDWLRTYNFIEITIDMLEENLKRDKEIIECINDGNFTRRITQHCVSCQYYLICRESYVWRKKFGTVRRKIDKGFLPFLK